MTDRLERGENIVKALPEPYSDELKEALRHRGHGSPAHQQIYDCLYQNQSSPQTDAEITEFVFELAGKRYSQLQRRRRQVGEIFHIAKESGHRYRLIGWLPTPLSKSTTISQKLRYRVLQSGRCRLCGKSAAVDEVSLVVDHILPQAWGGSDLEENLQPLCEECNAGKKDYYGDFDQYEPLIRQAASADEPHRRIALLLKAFNGKPIPSDLLGAVASAKQYQEDWQKRLRELRELGIDFTVKKRKLETGRVVSSYQLTTWRELPEEPLAPIIKSIEKRKKKSKVEQ